jgi:hypothetical protein
MFKDGCVTPSASRGDLLTLSASEKLTTVRIVFISSHISYTLHLLLIPDIRVRHTHHPLSILPSIPRCQSGEHCVLVSTKPFVLRYLQHVELR